MADLQNRLLSEHSVFLGHSPGFYNSRCRAKSAARRSRNRPISDTAHQKYPPQSTSEPTLVFGRGPSRGRRLAGQRSVRNGETLEHMPALSTAIKQIFISPTDISPVLPLGLSSPSNAHYPSIRSPLSFKLARTPTSDPLDSFLHRLDYISAYAIIRDLVLPVGLLLREVSPQASTSWTRLRLGHIPNSETEKTKPVLYNYGYVLVRRLLSISRFFLSRAIDISDLYRFDLLWGTIIRPSVYP